MKKRVVCAIMALAMAIIPIYTSFAETAKQQTAEEDVNLVNCTEDEYRKNCYELWYDDVIFGKPKELEGKFVRLELFAELIGEIDMVQAASSYFTTQLINDYGLQHEYFQCGVKREPGSTSYVGEPIYVFFGDTYGTTSTQVSEGDHIVVYGKIIYAANNGWTGYNKIYVLPRMIENYGH